jgi:hypothetical protein
LLSALYFLASSLTCALEVRCSIQLSYERVGRQNGVGNNP